MAPPETYTPAEISLHNIPSSLWLIISGEVYDVTSFQHEHPGGAKLLKLMGGRDATKPFRKTHNERILKNWQYRDLCIGKVAPQATPTQKPVGRFGIGRLLSWKREKGVGQVQEVRVDGKEGEGGEVLQVKGVKGGEEEVGVVRGEDVVVGERLGMVEVERKERRAMYDVLSRDLALVAL